MRGTLREIGLLQLLQALLSSRATGELALMNGDQYAHIFLRDGVPLHAEADGLEGPAVLLSVQGWHIGEFEFLRSHQAPRVTIPENYHLPVLNTTVPFDPDGTDFPTTIELTPLEGAWESPEDTDPFLEEKLTRFLEQTPFCLSAYVCGPHGYIVAEAEGKTAPWALIDRIRGMIVTLFNNRLTVKRILIEDEPANAFLQRLKSGGMLVVVADPSTTLGAVTRAAAKFVEQMEN